jgi:hypothetical protein
MKITIDDEEVTVEMYFSQYVTGTMRKQHDGRCEFQSFEPCYFSSEEAEDFYNEHWEEIEEKILEKV